MDGRPINFDNDATECCAPPTGSPAGSPHGAALRGLSGRPVEIHRKALPGGFNFSVALKKHNEFLVDVWLPPPPENKCAKCGRDMFKV